jgi:hypothetical protein
MTTLEQLVADHTILIQKIIAEAKNEALNDAPKPKSITTNKLDLFSHISSNFDNLIKDRKEKNLISSFTMTPIKWTRNINCWAKDLDLTGTSCGIWGLGGVGGGTLITKKHVLLANHVPYPSLPATMAVGIAFAIARLRA